ncbi:MAG: hypothetical protein JW384_01761 [Nitrosomonadaceae bacterium]|nr:hypothetical protein [Nitrosomonadaceae bacterium]
MAKKYFVTDDLGMILKSTSEKTQQEIFENRIFEYILGDPRLAERIRRLDMMMVYLERQYGKDHATKYISIELIRRFSEYLFDNDALDLYLQVSIEIFKSGVNMQRATLKPAKHVTYSELLNLARQWFLNEFHRAAGTSLELSIKLSLFLLSKIAMASEQEVVTNLKGRGDFRLQCAISYQQILVAAITPPSAQTVGHEWLDCIIEAVEENSVANEVLDSIMGILALGSPDGQVHAGVLPADQLLNLGLSITGNLRYLSENPGIVTHPHNMDVLDRWIKNRNRKTEEDKRRGEKILEKFCRERDRVTQELRIKKQEILEKSRRLLRTSGVDHIEINVSPLWNAGVRAVMLYPEGHDFPNVGVKVLVRKETPHMLAFPGEFLNFKLNLFEGTLENTTHNNQVSLLTFLLEYILVDMMHRLMVEARELKPWRPTFVVIGEARPHRPVRPHLRRLQPGQKPSEQAQHDAQEGGWKTLPPGVTFVNLHYRGGQLEYDFPAEPVGVYDDDDLFNTVKR